MVEFVDALRYVRNNNGQFPPTLRSKEDQNELGESGVSGDVVQILKEEFARGGFVKRGDVDLLLCFVDGFLLFSDPVVVNELDIRLLIRAPYEKLKERREARSGYVTLDGNISQIIIEPRILEGSTRVF